MSAAAGLLGELFQPAASAVPGCRWLGYLDYSAARTLQGAQVRRRAAGEVADEILLCEHTPTLSLGPRTCDSELLVAEDLWQARGVSVIRTDRGGRATYHGPGQLMVYPVLSLRARRLGVKSFITKGLQAIADELRAYDLPAAADLDVPGVWLSGPTGERRAKIASVGVRIREGVSDHGFSVCLTGDLTPFSWFVPCGVAGAGVTSAEQELGGAWREQLPQSLCSRLAAVFLS